MQEKDRMMTKTRQQLREVCMIQGLLCLRAITSRAFAIVTFTASMTLAVMTTTTAGTSDARLAWTILKSPITSMIIPNRGVLGAIPTAKSIEVRAAPGEYEPASFVLSAMQSDMPSIRISVSDLVGDVSRIASDAVDIRLVKSWYQAGTAWYDIKRSTEARRLIPELLVKDDDLIKIDTQNKTNLVRLSATTGVDYVDVQDQNDDRKRILLDAHQFPIRDAIALQPFTLSSGSHRQVWITIHVPENAQAGTYLGMVTVMSAESVIGTIPLRLDVLPFHLSKPALEYSIYYRGILTDTAPTLSSEDKTETQMCAEFKNMIAHGISNPTVYQYSSDSGALDRVLRLRHRCGLSSRNLYYLGFFIDPKEHVSRPTALRKRLLDIAATAKKNGFSQTYFYGVDEAVGPELVRQREVWDFVHQQGGKLYVAGKTGTSEVVGGRLDLLVAAGVPSRSEATRYHAVGGRIYSYANPQVGVENPLIYRRNYGILLWQQDYDGAMPYAYQHSEGSPWNDFDGRYRDHMFTYPTTDGVIDTLAWEGFREGVDDMRYLATLTNRLQALKLCAEASEQFKAAEEYLGNLKVRPLNNLDEERLAIVNLLLGLHDLRCDNRAGQ